ncbi:structural maintenance of chromosomes protein 1A-like isoform X2 [Temnothorax curvispinosus]|uniref:Structural maintenance of chromosomes protein n=1 Tax=Temnothorax curvispinosus TaxID=300111 RepID=A0A6J1R564_9HYME|nr:structural maintenance of chromosomes protein 1A-like isoform X2 [Temnothorax curvispinosus]
MPIFLDSIVISNFKSFSGTTTIGPLRSFTAIIGPNGSGKSNIMDAISFALGEEPSSLRVKNLSKLIYEGSVNVTYVNVIFKLDETKKSFTRKISGEVSQYNIDDKTVTNVFYLNELREMGLDIKAGNFLIPQGYIECFAMKMPKDLTAMFEQTSNSITYKAEYDRLKLELLKAEEAVNFEHQRKKQILIQKKCAAEEKAETETYLWLKKQYNKKKLKFQLIRLLLIKKEAESLQDKEKEVKSRIDEYLRDKETAIHLLKRKQSQFKSLFSSLETIEQGISEMEKIIRPKKLEYVVFEDNISHWQKKRDCARVSLDSASKARDTNKRIIEELKDELKQIDNKLAELRKASQTSTIELSNSQVKRYLELTNETEYRTTKLVKQINSLMRDQQKDQDKLDNENRRKQDLEYKVKQTRLTKENFETRLKKLQSVEPKVTLMEKTAEKLKQKKTDAMNKSFSLENDIAKISEKLSQIDIDKNTISRQIKKKETIQQLKQLYSDGVYGRLSDFCKPIHPRYNVAVTKIFNKNMDAIVVDTRRTAMQCIEFLKKKQIGIETFLPLDSIKTTLLKEHLRNIKEPKNVKLLYDVLNISSTQISKAVLFVTQNTLVCETIEDARLIAQSDDKKKKGNDCVSLDGCFYRKDGTMSGGQVDLIIKAKQWEDQQVLALKEQKAQLMKEFRDLPKISLIQSELDEINVTMEELKRQNKYIEKDIKDTEDEIVRLNEELDRLDREIIELNMAISEIEDNIKKRVEKTKSMEKQVNAIKDKIFVDFCKNINVPDIDYYEKNNLRLYQKQKKRQMELEQQYDRIKNQLHFENENDTESKVLKWKSAVEQADAELKKAYQQERDAKIKIEREETEMSKLKDDYTNKIKDLENTEKKLAQYRSRVNVIGNLYLESQKELIGVQKKIEQKKIECNTIINECKIEDFIIPMSETSHPHRTPEDSFFTTSSSSNVESSDGCKVLRKIDFSRFPENIRNYTEENLHDMATRLNEKLTKIQNEFKDMNPNLKVDEKISLIAQQIQEINTNFQTCRNKCDKIQNQFKSVKAKRCKQFEDCLDFVAMEIDSILKSLVNDTSAQATILADNPEEPYAGNIIYNCIAPSKYFQPLQYLSGGEKSLASLALLFAFQRYKQIPFLLMDEGDAALDKANIKNVIRFIQSQINTMQIITISLHKVLYSNADLLLGVTTEPNCIRNRSKVFAIFLSKYQKTKDMQEP